VHELLSLDEGRLVVVLPGLEMTFGGRGENSFVVGCG
jgi:hypothetical protein